MSVVYFLLPLGLLITAAAVAAFVWAVRNGQLDDLDTPAVRILFDDERFDGPGKQKADEPDQA